MTDPADASTTPTPPVPTLAIGIDIGGTGIKGALVDTCLLYTSDAADE